MLTEGFIDFLSLPRQIPGWYNRQGLVYSSSTSRLKFNNHSTTGAALQIVPSSYPCHLMHVHEYSISTGQETGRATESVGHYGEQKNFLFYHESKGNIYSLST
jgi:hypothetical protein